MPEVISRMRGTAPAMICLDVVVESSPFEADPVASKREPGSARLIFAKGNSAIDIEAIGNRELMAPTIPISPGDIRSR
jgi:hypothetical protein